MRVARELERPYSARSYEVGSELTYNRCSEEVADSREGVGTGRLVTVGRTTPPALTDGPLLHRRTLPPARRAPKSSADVVPSGAAVTGDLRLGDLLTVVVPGVAAFQA